METNNPRIMYAECGHLEGSSRFDTEVKTQRFMDNGWWTNWKKNMNGLPDKDMARPGVYIQSEPNIIYFTNLKEVEQHLNQKIEARIGKW